MRLNPAGSCPEARLQNGDDGRGAMEEWVLRPVYVTGLMKSGTTFLLGLFDGHPALLVYPEEPSFDRIFGRRYSRMGDVVRDWLFGTPNRLHFGKQMEPWLRAVGESVMSWRPLPPGVLPTVIDWRAMAAELRIRGLEADEQSSAFNGVKYHDALRRALAEAKNRRDVVVATARALQAAVNEPEQPKAWLFKQPQPTYREFPFRWFFDEFGEGKAVVLIRDPRGFVNSLMLHRAKQEPGGHLPAWRKHAHFLRLLRRLEQNYMRYMRVAERFGPERVRLVFYERLVRDPEPPMRELAKFLGLPFDDVLMQPTRFGRPVRVPTATRAGRGEIDADAAGRWGRQLGPIRVAIIEAALHQYFRHFPEPYRPVTSRATRAMLRPPLFGLFRIMDWTVEKLRPFPGPPSDDPAPEPQTQAE